MSLLEDLNGIKKMSNECTVARILRELSDKEAQALQKVIDTPDTSMTMLARVLESHGIEVNRKTLTRHRNRGQKDIGCVCP